MPGCRNDAGKRFHILDLQPRTPVSELSVCPGDREDVGVHRAKLAAFGLSNPPTIVHQVRQSLTVERLVDDGGQFIDDSLLHLKPVKTTDNW